ncbi:hypothetical protein CVD28_08875 [Bacillus sp. M6-12]|nr:hypothetical protein CVD28_08875 [Bacillus sp. M6-12]
MEVTGGAGYIGSHTVRYFINQKEDVVVVDNLQSGQEARGRFSCFFFFTAQGQVIRFVSLCRAVMVKDIDESQHLLC